MTLNLNEHGALKPLWLEMENYAQGIIEHEHARQHTYNFYYQMRGAVRSGAAEYCKRAHKFQYMLPRLGLDPQGLPYYEKLTKILGEEMLAESIRTGKTDMWNSWKR